jgi:hypothetical protein
MDYLTRKSVAKQYGSVGTWLFGSTYPRLGAIGVRCGPGTHRLDRREVAEAFKDLGLLAYLPQHGGLRPAEIEHALAEAGTPEELKQRAREFLLGIASKSPINQSRSNNE